MRDAIIVGTSTLPLGANHAFYWSQSIGMVDLNTFLPALGVDLSHWTLTNAQAISADGRTIVGFGEFDGQPRAFHVSGIPAPGAAGLFVLAGVRGRRRRA